MRPWKDYAYLNLTIVWLTLIRLFPVLARQKSLEIRFAVRRVKTFFYDKINHNNGYYLTNKQVPGGTTMRPKAYFRTNFFELGRVKKLLFSL